MAESMNKAWQARKLVKEGYSVKQISTQLGVTESFVRSYTKTERANRKKLIV